MRTVLVIFTVLCALRASVWMDPTEETYALVDDSQLAQCQRIMTSNCFADMAWALAGGEREEVRLMSLVSGFAELEQWDRAESLLTRMSKEEGSSVTSIARKDITAERLALDLSVGNDAALKAVKDNATLAQAASRLLGYPSIVGAVDRRLSEGIWSTRLKATQPMQQALVLHWDSLPSDGRSLNHQIDLANALLQVGNRSRARDLARQITPKPNEGVRQLIELLMRLNEHDRALDVAGLAESRYRPAFLVLVAESLARDLQDPKRAARLALDAAEIALAQRDFDTLQRVGDLLGRIGQRDEARRLAARAEVEAQRHDFFRPHRLSAVGQIHGFAGDTAACLRLQTEALNAAGASAVAFGFVARSIGYGKARFDLLPELTQLVALRRFECGEVAALHEVAPFHLARSYCSLLARGFVAPADILGNPDRWAVWADASSCHFERGETAQALDLLKQLEAGAQTMLGYSDRFRLAQSAAELACVYADAAHCQTDLHVAGRLLINELAARRLPAVTVMHFATAWRFRVEM